MSFQALELPIVRLLCPLASRTHEEAFNTCSFVGWLGHGFFAVCPVGRLTVDIKEEGRSTWQCSRGNTHTWYSHGTVILDFPAGSQYLAHAIR